MFRRFFVTTALIVVQVAFAQNAAKTTKGKNPKTAPLTPEQRAIHAVSRFTFGARPGDVQRVEQMGVDAWFEQQLAPERIEDKLLDARLGPLRTTRMSPKDMLARFPNQNMLRAVADGRQPMPDDPVERLIYEVQVERYRDQQRARAVQQEMQKPQVANMAVTVAVNAADAPNPQAEADALAASEVAGRLLVTPPQQRLAALETMPVHDVELLASPALKGDIRNRIVQDMPPPDREVMAALQYPQAVIVNELQQAKLLRAIYSERQLQEVMTDFWFNHFNIFINKDADQYFTTAYERDVIRPRALGKFQDLLVAVAHSPAMLVYLDNAQSTGPNSPQALNAQRNAVNRPNAPPPPGLNENYARELMELHTLGVNGGYTQQDVQEVAKVFTGWTIDQPQQGGGFKFEPRRHEPGPKLVLGKSIGNVAAGASPADGEQEGLQVLSMLAHHPSTAHFISLKLARRFVADEPPQTLVNRMAETFLKSDGDIKEVLRTMFRSPEFWQPQFYRAKMKTPFEFIASAMRACAADVPNAQPLVGQLQRMGMPLYGAQPPTGYSSFNETWTNSDALLDRMNFALQFANNRPPNPLVCDPARTVALEALETAPAIAATKGKSKNATLAALPVNRQDLALYYLQRALVPQGVSPKTRDAILKRLSEPDLTTGLAAQDPMAPLRNIAGLLLGSPEFQER